MEADKQKPQNQSDQHNDKDSPNEYIAEICNSIISNIQKDIRREQLGTYKLFYAKTYKKTDIERVIRQKKFIKMVENKGNVFNEPLMPLKKQNRIHKTMDCEDLRQESELRFQAQKFILKIKQEKRARQGKLYLKKKQEREKMQKKQKEKKIEEALQNQMNKKIRRMKAQKNIQYFKEKRMINLPRLSVFNSPNKSKVSEISSEDYRRNNSQSPSYYDQHLEEIKQEQQQRLPNGVNIKKKNPKQKSNFDEQKQYLQKRSSSKISQTDSNSIILKLHKIEDDNEQKIPFNRIKNRKKATKQSRYVINRQRTQDYSKYFDFLTKDEHSQSLSSNNYRQDKVRSPSNIVMSKTPNYSHRITNIMVNDKDDFSHRRFRRFNTSQSTEIFPLLNSTKQAKKKLRSLSTVD